MNRMAPGEAFVPSDEVVARLPDKKGNDINGLGEADRRRPSPIMWHDPDLLAHGELQKWFYANGSAPRAREYRLENRQITEQPLPALAPAPVERSAEAWTALVKEAALAREADQVGIARLRPEWIFEGYEAPYEWMIMIAVAMDPACIATAPSHTSQTEVQKQYLRGTRASHALAGWMRGQGWDGHPHGGPAAGPVLMVPAAIEAGLGELGKHGSMISRHYGSSFRLACVLTNMPLVADAPASFGADDFCASCQVCTRACPPDAIFDTKQTVRGDAKWYVDFDKCIPYFVENNGCGICIGQCPWSRPGVAPSLAERMSRRRARGAG